MHGIGHHAVGHQVRGDLVAVLALDPEEGETGGQFGAQWRDQFDLRTLLQALFQVTVERVNTRLDLGLAQLKMHLNASSSAQRCSNEW